MTAPISSGIATALAKGWVRVVIAGYLVGLALVCTYVPWEMRFPGSRRQADGYGFLWSPPEQGLTVDRVRLQLAVLALSAGILAALLVVTTRRQPTTGRDGTAGDALGQPSPAPLDAGPEPRTSAEFTAAGWERVPDVRGRAFYDTKTADRLARDLRSRGYDASVQRLNSFIRTVWSKLAEAPAATPEVPADRAAWGRQAAPAPPQAAAGGVETGAPPPVVPPATPGLLEPATGAAPDPAEAPLRPESRTLSECSVLLLVNDSQLEKFILGYFKGRAVKIVRQPADVAQAVREKRYAIVLLTNFGVGPFQAVEALPDDYDGTRLFLTGYWDSDLEERCQAKRIPCRRVPIDPMALLTELKLALDDPSLGI